MIKCNPIHTEILHQGVDAWNRWRMANPAEKPHLDGVYFGPELMCGINLKGAFLRGCEFDNTELSWSDCSFANFEDSSLVGVRLERARLRGAQMNRVNLRRSTLYRADLSMVWLQEADLLEADLSHAILVNSELQGANFTLARLPCANLSNADMTGVCIRNWFTTQETNFGGIKCDYIYRRSYPCNAQASGWQFTQRVPSAGSNFVPGEWELMHKHLHTVREMIESRSWH